MNVQFVGKVMFCGDTVVKTYKQTKSGSAWKKIGTDVLLLKDAGFENIILRINHNHPNRNDMISVAKSICKFFDGVKLEEIREL